MSWTQTDNNFGVNATSPTPSLLTEDLTISKANPGVVLEGTEANAQQIEVREQGGSMYYVVNADFNGTHWVCVNTANPAYGERHNSTGAIERIYSAATAGNITWTVTGSQVASSGDTTIVGKLIAGTVGPVSGQQHTVPAVASDTFVLLAASQTLTNKTLTAPVLGGTVTGTIHLDGTPSFGACTVAGNLSGGGYSIWCTSRTSLTGNLFLCRYNPECYCYNGYHNESGLAGGRLYVLLCAIIMPTVGLPLT